jgi:hypothetical protein
VGQSYSVVKQACSLQGRFMRGPGGYRFLDMGSSTLFSNREMNYSKINRCREDLFLQGNAAPVEWPPHHQTPPKNLNIGFCSSNLRHTPFMTIQKLPIQYLQPLLVMIALGVQGYQFTITLCISLYEQEKAPSRHLEAASCRLRPMPLISAGTGVSYTRLFIQPEVQYTDVSHMFSKC